MKRVFLLICLSIIGIGVLSAQSVQPELNVKGESKIFQKPDIMEISVSVNTKADDYQSCIDENLKNVDQLKLSLKKASMKSLEVIDLGQQVREERGYNSGRSFPDGFRATYNLKLKLEAKPEEIHNCLNVLKSAKVDLNYSAAYGISPELAKSVEEKLITEAVHDAKAKAEILAEAAGIQLSSIKSINYGVVKSIVGPKQYLYERADVKMSQSGAQSFLNPDDIVLIDQVEISYWLVQP